MTEAERRLLKAIRSLRKTALSRIKDGEVKDAQRIYDHARWSLNHIRNLRNDHARHEAIRQKSRSVA